MDIYEVDQQVYNEINNKLIPGSQVCFKAEPEKDGSLDFINITPLTPTCQKAGFVFNGEFGALIPMGSGNMLTMLAFTVNPNNPFQYPINGTGVLNCAETLTQRQLIIVHVQFSSPFLDGGITALSSQVPTSACP